MQGTATARNSYSGTLAMALSESLHLRSLEVFRLAAAQGLSGSLHLLSLMIAHPSHPSHPNGNALATNNSCAMPAPSDP